MLSVLSLVLPVFGLIGLGLLTARLRWLDINAARVLSEFGYKIALPALLFRAMSAADLSATSPLPLMGAYFTGITTMWIVATLATWLVLRRPAADGASIAMATCFGNGVMLGIPLILSALGDAAATPIAFLVTVETAYLWILATLHIETASRGVRSISFSALGTILYDVARNPIVASVLLGLAWSVSGISMPALPDRLIALLAQSAVPVSLFALGMSLASYGLKGEVATMSLVCGLKLAVYPALALMLGLYVFELPPLWAATLFVFTSMPVGANAFLFASRYDRAVGSVSAAVAVSTAIAVISVTIVLALVRALGLGAQA